MALPLLVLLVLKRVLVLERVSLGQQPERSDRRKLREQEQVRIEHEQARLLRLVPLAHP